MSDNITPATKTDEPNLRPPVLANRSGLSFNLSGVVKEYYGPMRFLGYASSVFADWWVDSRKKQFERDKKEGRLAADASFDSDKLKNKFARYETAYFSAVTGIYALRDWQDMLRYFRGAVAAEQGRAPSAVTSQDMMRSQNPIIQTALRRFTAMNVVRFGTDFSFLGGMNWGLLGMAFRITCERTLFNQKTSYDRLEKLLEETQVHLFDLHAESKISKELGNIIQQCQKDHGRAGWSREIINHYSPLFKEMAEAITRKEIGMPETVFILGELMTKRLTLPESLTLVAQIREKGMDNLRSYSKEANLATAVPEQKSEPKITAEFAEKYLANSNSMQPKSLLAQGQRSFMDMARSQVPLVQTI